MVTAQRIHTDYKQSTDRLKQGDGQTFEGWLTESERWFEMVAGDQWDTSDRSNLLAEDRPVVTMNRIGVYVDAVKGLEIQNRNEVRFYPRGLDDAKISEYMNGVVEWARDSTDMEEEETEAFADLLVCGMGWTYTAMTYEEDLEGEIEKICIEPLRCRWDPASTRKNLKDSRWRMYIKDMRVDEIEEKWPDAGIGKLGGPWDSDIRSIGAHRYSGDQAWKYDRNMVDAMPDEVVRIAVYQYVSHETVYRIDLNGKTYMLSPAEFEQRKEMVAMLPHVKQDKRVIRQALCIGGTVVEDEPAPDKSSFTLQAITGKYDKRNRCFYGLVRPLIDPQKWINKFFSSILYIIATNPKGGILAEEDAFENPRQAEEEWARADSIIWTKPGAIQSNKIMPKPIPPYPQAMDRLMQYATESMPSVSGVNLEIMGLVQRDQPGVLEYQRKQAGVTMLAWAFNALRRYRKQDGRVMVNMIREYISDNRIIRIQGKDGQKYLPLVKDAFTLKYDIIVDEAPTSTNAKDRTWAMLVDIVPNLLQAGIPVPPDIIQYSPLPEGLKQTWQEYIQKGKQQDPMIEEEKKTDIDETKSKIKLNIAKAQQAQADAGKKSAEIGAAIGQ